MADTFGATYSDHMIMDESKNNTMNVYYVLDLFVDGKMFDSWGEWDLESARNKIAELKISEPECDWRIRKVTEEYI